MGFFNDRLKGIHIHINKSQLAMHRIEKFYEEVYDTLSEDVVKEYGHRRKLVVPKRKVKEFAVGFYGAFKRTLVHEIQHMIDYHRSSGKYNTDANSRDYYNKRLKLKGSVASSDEMYNQYLSLPHEYWARWSELMSTSKWTYKPSGADKSVKSMFFRQNPREIMTFLSNSLKGWDKLTTKDKRRILKATLKHYEAEKAKHTGDFDSEPGGTRR